MPPWVCRVSRLVMGVALTAGTVGVMNAQTCEADSRCLALRNFFLRYESPLEKVAQIFVRVADEHRLDWRLLPAISMVETSGGKHGKSNNVFGWNSGKTQFASVEAGILYLGSRFGKSRIYAGRTAMGILQNYNPSRKTYPPKVTRVRLEMSSVAVE